MDEKEITDILQLKLDGLKGKFATPDQFENFKKDFTKNLNDSIEDLKKGIDIEGIKEEGKKSLEDLKADFEKKFNDQNEILIKQGKEIAKKTNQKTEGVSVIKEFKEKYEEFGGGKDTQAGELFSIKAWDSSDTVTYGTVDATTYPDNGSTSNVAGGEIYSTQIIPGIWAKKRPITRIMEFVNRIPLIGNRLVTMSEKDIVGDAEFTKECDLKPIVKITYEATESTAKKVAAFWKTNEEIRKYLPAVTNKYRSTVTELINEKVPKGVLYGDTETGLVGIKDRASAFTPNPALQIHDTPNEYDSLGAMIASLEGMGYMPDVIMMHPYKWRAMKQNKEDDGHYSLSNGSSIQILSNGIEWDGRRLEIIKDPTMGVDEVFVADLEVVFVAIDNEIIYREGYNNDGDMRRNLLAHVNEIFLGVAIPEGATAGLVYDTFANVKTLITI